MRKYKEHDFLAACREGNVEAVQIFLDQEGFDVNENFESGVSGRPVHGLYLAAQEGHAEVVKMLVNTEGVDVNQ
ncbi:ankyrin repeat domain-containing protein, partial [Sansalvadorimonas verongulae]|uniref:ankyrin repeat domain-containing protein n=1 Tax=Sansalvadorimonas verongulae TaxID=2172824 RepID=UPI0018AD18EB